MSQTKEQIEQELHTFKQANPDWMTNKLKMGFVASFNNRLTNLNGKLIS